MSGFAEIFALWVDKLPSLCYARLVHIIQAHSIEIENRLPNTIKHSFIFKKPFINVF